MATAKRNYYEGMFLFPQTMAPRLQEAIEHLNELLNKVGAEVVAMKKWGEKSLAYPIRNNRRGVYLLAYFSCDTANMAEFERDCTLSELLLRFLIIRADHLTVEEMTSHDDRENLHVEAKMRADQSSDSESGAAAAPAAPAEPVTAGVSEGGAVDDASSDADDK